MITRINNISFTNNSNLTPQKTKDNQTKKNIIYAGAAVAISAAAFGAYFIHHKFSAINKQTSQIFDEVSKLNSKVSKYDLNKYKFMAGLNGLKEFKYFVVAKKNNSPLNSMSSSIVKFNNESERQNYNIIKSISGASNKINISGLKDKDAKSVTEMLTDALDEKYLHVKFNGSNFENLQNTLNGTDNNTYVYMENMKDFLDNGGKLPDKLFYFSKMHKSPINLSLTKDVDFKDDYFNFASFTPDTVQEVKNIKRFVMLESDLLFHAAALKKGKSAFFSITNKDKEQQNVVKFIAKELNVPLYNIKAETFEQDFAKIINYKDSTGKPLLGYLENTLSKEQYEKLEKANIGLCGNELPYEQVCPVYTLPYSKLEEDVYEVVKRVQAKLKGVKIDYKEPESIKNEILYHLARNTYDETRPKGILFHGNTEKSAKLLKQISEILDMPVKTVDFTDFMSGLSQFIKYINKCKEPGNKMLIDLVNIEQHLQKPTEIEAVKRINRFKNVMELSFENSFAAAVLRTDKDLYSFETASIAPHRFDVQLPI